MSGVAMRLEDAQEVKTALFSRAASLGFEICRIAPASAPPHAAEFRRWLAEGAHGDMDWLARNADRRTDPSLVLPGAAAIILLAMNYWQLEPKAVPGAGRIARYAWGDDYHDVIGPRLWELDAFLQGHGGQQRQYVDTGPVLERDHAAVAGLGWQGKSTMLIHPRYGTWLFLAAILTTLPLPADDPMRDHCGKCTRCIDACPTSAITEPRRVDARLCISYLTIENKGSIPEALRPLIGDRIYGCDTCLEVCPWNRFAIAGRESRLAAKPGLFQRLRDYLALDDAAFRTLFAGSPIKRIKRRGFLRNVCVALGNVGTPDDLPALHRACGDEEPLIAEHARWAIAQITARNKTGS